jgi:hypothetical protein
MERSITSIKIGLGKTTTVYFPTTPKTELDVAETVLRPYCDVNGSCFLKWLFCWELLGQLKFIKIVYKKGSPCTKKRKVVGSCQPNSSKKNRKGHKSEFLFDKHKIKELNERTQGSMRKKI